MGELASFLIQPAQEGYPADYLVARITGRRPNLVTDWLAPPAPGPPEAPVPPGNRAPARGMTARQAREKMRQEFRWVYLQMNQGLRNTFAPLFLWFEVRTILVCLRLRRGGEPGESAGLPAATLLAPRVQLVLSGEREPYAGGDALSDLQAALAGPGCDLGEVYRAQGGRAYEQRFVTLYLERMTSLALHPVLSEFFRALVDLMNLLFLAKQMRWQLEDPRALIRGGTIATERLEKVLKKGSAAALAALLRSQPGLGDLPAVPDNLEQFLLCRLTRQVRGLGRDPLGIGRILDYLWGCSVEARNASLVHHGAALGESALRAELIG